MSGEKYGASSQKATYPVYVESVFHGAVDLPRYGLRSTLVIHLKVGEQLLITIFSLCHCLLVGNGSNLY